jgi:uncharacterized surface anchored protein
LLFKEDIILLLTFGGKQVDSNKLKKVIVLLTMATSIGMLNQSKANAAEWVESKENPNLSTTSGDLEIHYTYGFNQENGIEEKKIPTGMPNVYLVDKKNDKVVQHQNGYSAMGGGITSSSFLLGFLGEDNKYHVFSSLYKDAEVYTDGTTIRGVSKRDVPGYGEFEFESYLTPKNQDTISHKYVITNTGKNEMTFRAMKNVDTNFNGKDNVPIYMLGKNEGLYIKAGDYRLNYRFAGENPPANFQNHYSNYRAPSVDQIDSVVPYPYTPADITGGGAEIANYQPDEAVAGTGDTGIYMKWDEVTLKPGESKSFTYELSLMGNIETYRSYVNKTQDSGENYPGDIIEYTMEMNLDDSFSGISSGYIQDTLADGLSVVGNYVEVLDSNGTVIKSVPMSDVYDESTNTIKVELKGEELQDHYAAIRYTAKADSSLANKTAKNEGTYMVTADSMEKVVASSMDVPFSKRNPRPVTVSYVDQSGNLLELDDQTENPIILTGEYDQEYKTEKKEIIGYEFDSVQGMVDGKFSEEPQIVKYIYKEQPSIYGAVVTKYVDESGKEIALRNTSTGEVGTKYTTEEKEIPGYDLDTIQGEATGEYKEGEQVVIYVYKKKTDPAPVVEGSVVTKYVDESGKEIALRNTSIGEIGTEYVTEEKKISGYELDTIQGETTGEYKEGEQTIIYVYKKVGDVVPVVEGSVVTKYVDESGKEIAGRNTNTGEVGADYTTEEKTIPGYELTEIKGGATGEYKEGEQVVTYVYKKKTDPTPVVEGNVVTKYVDESGKEIALRNTSTGEVGTKYTTEEKEIPGYDLDTIQGEATGEYKEGEQVVIYVYKKKKNPTPVVEGSVVTKYVDESGKEIALRNTSIGEIGTEYVTEEKKISGYELDTIQGETTGEYKEGEQTIIYVYKKVGDVVPVVEGSVVTKYVNESGKEIAGRAISTGEVGTLYITKEKTISGYTLETIQGDATGEYEEGEQIITYVYKKIGDVIPVVEGDIVTKYVDENGKEIAKRNMSTGEVGTAYTTEEKLIPGYELQVIQGEAAGEYKEGEQVITYVYKKKEDPTPTVEGSIITKYVDESGKEIAGRNTSTGSVGEAYTAIEKAIPGYELDTIQGEVTGEYKEGEQVIIYVYKKKEDPTPVVEGSIITKYVDESGKEIAGRSTSTGEVGANYVTEEKVISGYSLKEIQGEPAGVYTEGEQTVVYVYEKDKDIPEVIQGSILAKYVDEEGNEIAARDTSIGEVGSLYVVNPKAISGYQFKEIQGDVQKYTEGQQVVIYVYKKNVESINETEKNITLAGDKTSGQKQLYNSPYFSAAAIPQLNENKLPKAGENGAQTRYLKLLGYTVLAVFLMLFRYVWAKTNHQ